MKSSLINNTIRSTCSYCGVGCGIIVKRDFDGRIKVEGDKLHPANKGMLCSKGMNLHYTVEDKSDRLLYPEMRSCKTQERERVSWDFALAHIASEFKSIIRKYGPDAVGFYVSGQCLTEEYYIVNKLAKGFIGTNNIDTNSRLCMSSAVVGYKMALGEDSVPISYDDIELADCFFITGANPAWCHPILFRRIEAHKENNPDVKIIVVDPRKTQTCANADLHLQINPGADVYLNNAIAKCLIEDGYADKEFLNKYTEGYEKLAQELKKHTLSELAQKCGITLDEIKLAAKLIGESKGFISMWAMGLNQSVIGVNKNLSLINLSLIIGKIGKPGCGPFSLTGQPNAMGGREVGGMCNLLPAHRNLDNPSHRKEVANFWGVGSVPEKPGLSATEMFEALNSDKLKAIWIICTNPLVSIPNARFAEAALEKAEFVVVQDISSKSITNKYADVLLPAAGWLEKEGTMTNSDRRISHLSKGVEPPGEALPDIEIVWRFARKMGFSGFNYTSAGEIFEEHCRLTENTNMDISGLTYDYLKNVGTVQWPFNAKTNEGTPRLFTDKKFYTPTGKAHLYFVDGQNESEMPSANFPLVLTTGRIRDQWHTMTKTGKVNKLNRHIKDAYLEIHPENAKERNIEDGDLVEILNSRGNVRVKAKVTDEIKKGVVFLPMHWGKVLNSDHVRANNLTSDLKDPKSKEPDFKYSTVNVQKYKKLKQRIIIIGAGAAAYRYITAYRELNAEDEIIVFSKEAHPFYNRVQLPDYLNGQKQWDNLLKISEEEIKALNVKVYKNTSIAHIYKDEKQVVDSNANYYSYDILILATGSRASYPKNIELPASVISTIRERSDIDYLKQRIRKNDSVVVVGGGLLGLEIASSFIDNGAQVSLVHRNNKLMNKQLDDIACQLLNDIVQEKGIEVYFNDEIASAEYDESDVNAFIHLKSGKRLKAKSLVYAIGTIPNIELAKDAGLNVNKGVVVNSYLQTSDESIFALGEIAEFEGQLYGITSAAEEQAEVLAKYISGDLSSVYSGSTPLNILKFPGVQLCSIGITETANDKDYQEIMLIDKAARYYKKCIVKNDRLVGAILMGDKSEFNDFRQLIDSKMELSEKRLQLLRGVQTTVPLKGKLVCSCNNVGDINIKEEIEKGTSKFEDLCLATGAGTGCGSCKPEVKNILKGMLELSAREG